MCLNEREFNGVRNELEYTAHEYDVLCLRASPASLKILSRESIRLLANRSNARLDSLAASHHLPHSLVDYVKYKSYIATGDCLLRGEKLVSYDGAFELELRTSGGLVYRPLPSGLDMLRASRPVYDKIKKFKCCFYNYFEDASHNRDEIQTYPTVESIWLLSSKIVLHSYNGKSRVSFNYGEERPAYVLTFDAFAMIENFLNNTSSNVIRRKRIKTWSPTLPPNEINDNV